jgi:hypothetical protein
VTYLAVAERIAELNDNYDNDKDDDDDDDGTPVNQCPSLGDLRLPFSDKEGTFTTCGMASRTRIIRTSHTNATLHTGSYLRHPHQILEDSSYEIFSSYAAMHVGGHLRYPHQLLEYNSHERSSRAVLIVRVNHPQLTAAAMVIKK